MRSTNHPWRAHTREFANREFTTFVDNRPKAERRQLKAAERDFLAARNDLSSLHAIAARDFAAGLRGRREFDGQ